MGDNNPDKSVEARRIIKLFFQIAENLELSKLSVIRDIVKETLDNGKEENKLKNNQRKFYNLVIFKSGISVNLCKQGMRSLLLIRDNSDIGNELLEAIQTKLSEQFPTLAGMHELDEKSMRIYLNALEKGKENLKHIRLMVVGMFEVGKTCLVRRLQNEDIDDVSSTEGIEINVNVCEINEDDDCWTKSEGVNDSDIDGRVNDVLLNTTLDQQDSEPVKRTKRAKPVNKKKIPEPAENPHFRKPSPPKEPKPGQIEESREVKKAISILNKKEEGTDKKISRFVKRPIASGRKPTVSLWDFAGQSVYYSTHHFFLSSRSIYLLVLDISKRLDQEVDESYECFGNLQGSMKKYTCLDAFKFWVTSIYAYTQYQNMNEDKGGRNQPTIVLVGTHGDKLEVKDKGKDKEKQKDDYFEKALESFNDPIMKMFHKKSFLVSCTEDENTVFNEIKVEIYKIAKAQTYWNEGTPAKWLPLERSIEQKKKSKNKLMKFDDVKEADAGNELTLDDIEEIKLFLKIQHFLGKVMYFDAKGLDDTVILNPQWIIDIFKLFVNHKPLLDIPKQIQDLWKEYKRTAKLTQPLLDYLIDHSAETTEGKENQFKEHRMQVVGYMEHLDVIAKPVSPKPQVNPEATIPKEIESNKDEDFYFVPCMLKQLTAADDDHNVVRQLLNLEKSVTGISTPVLCFVFNCKCLPPSIFHRLLATYIKKLQIKQHSTWYIIYNDFGAFKLDDNQTLCIWYTEFIIYARVKLHAPSYGVLYTDKCIALRKELKDTLLSILLIDQQNHPQKSYVKGAFTQYIKCEHLFKSYPPTSPQSHDAMDGLHEVRKIEQNELKTVNCTCSIAGKTDHSISSDKALDYWYKEPKHLEHISAWFKRKEKDQGFLSEKPHSDDDFSELDKHLPFEGEEFVELGTLLDVAPTTINELRNKGAVELIKKWTKQGKDENTWGLLKEKLYKLKEKMNLKKSYTN